MLIYNTKLSQRPAYEIAIFHLRARKEDEDSKGIPTTTVHPVLGYNKHDDQTLYTLHLHGRHGFKLAHEVKMHLADPESIEDDDQSDTYDVPVLTYEYANQDLQTKMTN